MGTVSLERYAAMRAEMDAGSLRDQVLSAAGVSVDDWIAAQRDWLEKMGAEIELGKFELSNRYSAAFLERQNQIEGARSQVAAPLAPTGEPAASEATASPPSLPAHERPSFERSPSPSPERMPGPTPENMPGPGPGLHSKLPFGDTSPGGLQPPAAAPLPFAASPGAPAASQPSPPAARKSGINPLFSSTAAGAAQSPVAALPFAHAAAAAPPPAAAPVRRTEAASPEPAAKKWAKFNTTMETSGLPAGAGAPLPFAPRPSPLSPGSSGASQPTNPAPVASKVGTAAAGPARIPTPVQGTPPARPPAPAASLTFEQYVSLCAEMVFAPQRTEEILARYHITRERKAELDASYKERFAMDRALEARWQEAYRVYFNFLSSRR